MVWISYMKEECGIEPPPPPQTETRQNSVPSRCAPQKHALLNDPLSLALDSWGDIWLIYIKAPASEHSKYSYN